MTLRRSTAAVGPRLGTAQPRRRRRADRRGRDLHRHPWHRRDASGPRGPSASAGARASRRVAAGLLGDGAPRRLRRRPGRARRTRNSRHGDTSGRPRLPAARGRGRAAVGPRPRRPRRGDERPRRVLLVPAHRHRRHQTQQPHRGRRARARPQWRSGSATSCSATARSRSPAGWAPRRRASCRRSTGSWRGSSRPPSTSTAPTACSPARAASGSSRWSTPCRGRRCRRRSRACGRGRAARPGRHVPGGGARGGGGRHPALHRVRPRQRLSRRARPPRAAARGLLRRGRVRHARPRRAAALGQAAHARPPPTCGPPTRASTGSSRCATGSTPSAGSATPTSSGCWDDTVVTTCRPPRCSSTPTRWTPTSPTWPPRLPGPAAAPARQGAQDHRARRAAGRGRATPASPAPPIREVEGMAAAGLGEDLLLANEVLDARRLGALTRRGSPSRSTRQQTLAAAVAGGVREVLVDVNVGLPRCGIAPDRAGWLADRARAAGLAVRGVMGYEGHLMMLADAAERARLTEECMAKLLAAHADVGGDVDLRRRHRHVRDEHLGHRGPGGLVRADGHRLHRGRAAVPAGAHGAGHRGLGDRPRRQPAGLGGRRRRAQGARHGPRQPHGERLGRGRCGSAPTSTSRSRPASRCAVGDRVQRRARPRRPDGRAARTDAPSSAATRCSTPGRSTCAAGDRNTLPDRSFSPRGRTGGSRCMGT